MQHLVKPIEQLSKGTDNEELQEMCQDIIHVIAKYGVSSDGTATILKDFLENNNYDYTGKFLIHLFSDVWTVIYYKSS